MFLLNSQKGNANWEVHGEDYGQHIGGQVQKGYGQILSYNAGCCLWSRFLYMLENIDWRLVVKLWKATEERSHQHQSEIIPS